MALSYGSDGAAIQRHAFDYRRSADQDAAKPARHAVVVVGAGPVGLSLAIDLAQRGQRVLLLDNDQRLSSGSRAICFAKRTLEIWDRLGVGDAMCAKGVQWNVGRVFFKDEPLYRFDLLPEPGHERPAFINLQQYYAEAYLAVRAAELPNIEIRWKNTVAACEVHDDHVLLGVDTPEGRYTLQAEYVAACDGSRSPLRALLGQESKGRVFRDRFLIADVKMAVDFPAERWFWFDPPFHPNQSVLLHRQPDGVWRIDFQLGWDADPEAEKQPERIKPRVDAMMRAALGHEVPFELEWASVYTFACLRMERFVRGRVFFAGDSAHAAPTAACRTPRTWPGSSTSCCAAGRRARCSTATAASVNSPPTRTCSTAPAPPTSSRPRARSRACSGMPRSTSRGPTRLHAASSTAAGCRCRPRCTARR
jgi:3-(3-hydroxy-phenyl)propionate hydroxylase